MKKIKILFERFNSKLREDKIQEISEELIKTITQSNFGDEKLSSEEMATIANNIFSGVKEFLSARKEKLTSDLADTENALKNL